MDLAARSPSPPPSAFPAATSANYVVRLARDHDEVKAAQRLRFQVFNLEMGEGLDQSYATGLDQDRFDDACDHILVFHAPTGDLAGTYRIQTGLAALAGLGYYSEQEFDFSPFEGLRSEMVELGRACVDWRHRNLSALGKLWKGIATYAEQRRARFLVGCSSLSTLDPDAAWSVYNSMARRHLAPAGLRTSPIAGWECPPGTGVDVAFPVPKLLRAYLSLGAKICGAPARDRQFGTIDFLTLLDLESLAPAARNKFFS
ncbi:MAG TPA: GNAT family N-acyltransferase [Opitutaceae bacterium]|nr:GNAT family N-acyltransferase [Opitutaceae bacterium]